MYESPIEIIMGEITTKWENGVLKAVQNYNVNCNKEELTKALAYDRDQYRKGFEDGRPKWIPCSERLPKPWEVCLLTVHCIGWNETEYNRVIIGTYNDNYKNHYLAWMPLPEPYKERNESI